MSGATVEPHMGPNFNKCVCATILAPPRCAGEARQWQWPGGDHQEAADDLGCSGYRKEMVPRSADHCKGGVILVEPTYLLRVPSQEFLPVRCGHRHSTWFELDTKALGDIVEVVGDAYLLPGTGTELRFQAGTWAAGGCGAICS